MTFKESFDKANEWQKKVALVSLYHNTQLMHNKKWRVRDTANYFGISMGHCSEDLKLSEQFDEVKECQSRNQALMRINTNG